MTITFETIEPDIASLINLAIEVSDVILNRDQLELAESLSSIQNMQIIAIRLKDMMEEFNSMSENKLPKGVKKVSDALEKKGK